MFYDLTSLVHDPKEIFYKDHFTIPRRGKTKLFTAENKFSRKKDRFYSIWENQGSRPKKYEIKKTKKRTRR